MGPCKICNSPGAFGFSQPGPRKDRRKPGYAWACSEHREEVTALWQAAFGPHSPSDPPAQSQHYGGKAVSGGARDPAQGRLI
jgi:hypothetical protein